MSKRVEKVIRVQVYDLRSVECLLASCAHAGALNEHTSVVTHQYDGTPAYNYLAYYFPVLRVQYKEVVRSDETFPSIVARTRQQLYVKLKAGFADAMRRGPQATRKYIEDLEFFREASCAMVQRTYDAVSRHNAGLDRDLKRAIGALCAVRAVSTVALATIGAIVGVTGTVAATVATAGIYFSYKLVNTFESAGASLANVSAVAVWNPATGQFGDILQELFNRLAGWATELNYTRYVAPIITGLIEQNKGLAAEIKFLTEVRKTYAASGMRVGVRNVEGQLSQKTGQIVQNMTTRNATVAGTNMLRAGVRYGLPVVWVANDTFNAWVEYRDTMSSL